MRTGRQTLHEIDEAVSQTRANLERTTELANRLAEERAAIQHRRLEAVATIAAERMQLLASGAAEVPRDRDLRRADKQATELLERHAEEISHLRERTRESQAELERLEAQRSALEDEVEDAVNAFEQAAAATQDALAGNDGYKSQLARVEEAEAVVDRAERKRKLAAEDEAEKGAPYRADRLFSYLWDRHYATKDYRGGLITRMLDDWVARLCNYRDAALNYKRLTEIPARLADHVSRVEGQAEAERAKLKAMEEEALERDGAAKLREASIAMQARLEELDAKIAAAEEAHHAAFDAENAAAGCGSSAFRKAQEILSGA